MLDLLAYPEAMQYETVIPCGRVTVIKERWKGNAEKGGPDSVGRHLSCRES